MESNRKREREEEVEEQVWKSTIHPYLTRRPIVDSWYRIKLSDLSENLLEVHKKNLTFQPTSVDFLTEELVDEIELFKIEGEELLVPFYYGFLNFGTDVDDRRRNGRIDPTNPPRLLGFEGKHNEEILRQITACEKICASLDTMIGCATLASPPGTGKTFMAISAWITHSQKLGYLIPTMVLVHTDFLADQWIESINKLVPGANIGRLQGKILDYEGKDIVICTLQSLTLSIPTHTPITYDGGPKSKKRKTGVRVEKPVAEPQFRYDEKVLGYFQMAIIDECHRSNADQFSRCFPMTGFRYYLLLSGTPKRKDGKHFVSESWVGEITFSQKRTYTKRPIIYHFYPEYPPMKEKYSRLKRKDGTNKLDHNLMVKDICVNHKRTAEICDQAIRFLKLGRKMLGFSERCTKVKHLQWIKEIILAKEPSIKIGIFTSETKKKDRPEVFKSDLILTTFKMASEALDIPDITAGTYFVGTNDVSQSLYRAVRGFQQTEHPCIIDPIDNFSFWRGYYHKRDKFYRQEKFIIKYLDKDGKVIKTIDYGDPEQQNKKKRKMPQIDDQEGKKKQRISSSHPKKEKAETERDDLGCFI